MSESGKTPMSNGVPRRHFLQAGLAAVGALMVAPNSRGAWSLPRSSRHIPPWIPLSKTRPILAIPPNGLTISVGGLPFAPTWFGDSFDAGYLPFHNPESPTTWAQADEHIDVAIIGGGLSGLASAYAMRERDFALFDLRPRFGGNAMGEKWKQLPYSLGSAYFMVPDEGDELDTLYTELGVYRLAEVDEGSGFRFEYGGKLLDDICKDCTPAELAALQQYRTTVEHFANIKYPEIPWTDPAMRDFIRSLDTQTFHGAVDECCGQATPPLLAKALQAYCYSSFGVGWDELSAAAGWNFVAAEEFGRIVLPGGNAGFATLLWKELARLPHRSNGRPRLRAQCIVTNIKMLKEGVLLAWRDPSGTTHTIAAKSVVYAGSKHILKHMLPDLATLDPEKFEAVHQVPTVAYLVVNVLLKERVHEQFYDLFAIHDDQFPMDEEAFELDRRITDAVNGTFALATPHPHGDILTLYWPLPWHTARFSIIADETLQTYAEIAAPQIKRMLDIVGVSSQDVASIRMTRWGHAMPYARPGAYSGDLCDILRRPISDRLWFANQDNWLLPAVETCLSEASWVAQNMPG